MPANNVAPTKSNLLREKERLFLALEGYELLERKREILVMELMRRVEEVKILERELERRTSTAYPALRRMLLAMGRDQARDLAEGTQAVFSLKVKKAAIAGLSILTLEAKAPSPKLGSSFMNSFADSDETVLEFSELLKLIAEAAGLRSIVWRLAKEVRKTQRRVNALEKMVIPESRMRAKFIESSLEEREREAVFVVKLLKTRSEGGG